MLDDFSSQSILITVAEQKARHCSARLSKVDIKWVKEIWVVDEARRTVMRADEKWESGNSLLEGTMMPGKLFTQKRQRPSGSLRAPRREDSHVMGSFQVKEYVACRDYRGFAMRMSSIQKVQFIFVRDTIKSRKTSPKTS